MFQIPPKTKEQAFKPMYLFDEGEYHFEVMEINEKISRSTNKPMLEVKLEVFSNNKEDEPIKVYDYMLADNNKVHKFLYAIGQDQMAITGNVDTTGIIDKTGRCKLIVQHDNDGKYKPKNVVEEYLLPNDSSKEIKKNEPFVDSNINRDIPF